MTMTDFRARASSVSTHFHIYEVYVLLLHINKKASYRICVTVNTTKTFVIFGTRYKNVRIQHPRIETSDTQDVAM